MNILSVKIDDLLLDDKNARKHSERNLAAIVHSLSKFGQRKPIVVRNGKVLAGNGTLLAAKELGWEKIQVVEAPQDWDENTAKAYALADNRTAELAEWEDAELARQLLELEAADWNIEDLGFDMPQVVEEGKPEDDELPEVITPITQVGDLWQLGKHLLYCGDSTNPYSYQKLLGEDQVDMIWTDPPYGVAYVGKTKDALTIENDALDAKGLEEFLRQAFSAMYAVTKPGACWYVAAPSGNLFQSFSIPLSELEVWRHTLVWVKDTLVMGRADYHYRHESIFYGWTPGEAHITPPNRKQDTVWEIPRPKASREHPTMKPIELITRAITNSSVANNLVLDAFAGSGSTLIACEQTSRIARCIEVDPKYCDVIIKRWENYTGAKAEIVTGK